MSAAIKSKYLSSYETKGGLSVLYLHTFKIRDLKSQALRFDEIMQEYFSKQYQYDIYAHVDGDSIPSLLCMGMVPVDQPINLVRTYWGWHGVQAIEELPMIQHNMRIEKEVSSMQINTLQNMIHYVRTKNFDSQSDVSREDLLHCRDALTKLNEQNLSFVQEELIPAILEGLENKHLQDPLRSPFFSSVLMKMSEKGMQRWAASIDTKKEFIPFKNLELLYNQMNSQQMTRLQKVTSL